jgi:uncharacterized protein
MDLGGQRRSDNIEDERGSSPIRGGRRVAMGTGTVLVVLVVGTLLGADPQELLRSLTSAPASNAPQTAPYAPTPGGTAADDGKAFVAGVLGSTEDTWTELFRTSNATYPKPKLVLFRDLTESACGRASSSTGPFYCPADKKVYLDLAFFDELARRFQAPGDFAQAYVIAHEVGHHVQNLTGVEAKVRRAQSGASEEDQNALSVLMELQADCYAGVWAHHAQAARPFLQTGDVEEALAAATAIGDDRLQKQARGTVAPESFTHGSSAQRVKWFSTGFKSGSIGACDTFNAQHP